MPTGAAVVKDGDFFTDVLTGPLREDSERMFTPPLGGGVKKQGKRKRAREKGRATKKKQTSASHEPDPVLAAQQIPGHAAGR